MTNTENILREALEKAERGMFYAWQSLSAIHDSDPSTDRRNMRDGAWSSLKEVRDALLRAKGGES